MSEWKSHGYAVETTGDGSPTLRLLQYQNESMVSDSEHRPRPESMHHSGGAASETKYIYGKSIETILEKNLSLSVLVVGLGLGYIEILAVDLYLRKLEKAPQEKDFRMLSFEQDEFLTDNFLKYLTNNLKNSEASDVYDQVFLSILPTHRHELVKQTLARLFESKKWQIKGKLEEPFVTTETYNVIQYDAFSSNTTKELWEEGFLEKFLKSFASDTCCFSTYACKKSLKNALADQGFTPEVRDGFQGKRNCTFASRERAL